jgi:hypothetical protein
LDFRAGLMSPGLSARLGLTIVLLIGLGTGGSGLTYALFNATVRNTGASLSSAALTSPTSLTFLEANCTVSCVQLSWPAPPGNGGGNGYVIKGMNNGTNPTCPTNRALYTTYVGDTNGTSLTDSGAIAQGAQGTYACYLVQTGFDPPGPPPWGANPRWTSIDVVTKVAVRRGIYLVQVGPHIAASGVPDVTATLNAASLPGTLLVFTGSNDDPANPGGFTGPAGWVQADAAYETVGLSWSEIWYYPFNPGGITSATFTAGGTTASGQLSEWSGVVGTSPLDQSGNVSVAGPVASVTVSTSAATSRTGDLAITFFETSGAGTLTPPAGWTSLFNDGANGQISDYRITGGPAVISETMPDTVGGDWAAVIVTFK